MKQILLAFQFLTLVPVRIGGEVSEREIARSTIFFPLVGAFQGLLAILFAMIFLRISAEIAAGLVILILVISNGGFHLDGLADTFDALAVKSTSDRETDISRRLAIMKDSTTGAIAVVAIVLTIMLKFLFIKNLFLNASQFTSYSILFLMPVFSKWIMVAAMHLGSPARQDGLGRIFINNVKAKDVFFSSFLVTGLFTAVAKLDLLHVYSCSSVIALFMMLFAFTYGFSLMAVRFCMEKFNGLTGDTIGALSEISEIIFLMVVSAWLTYFI